MDTPDERKPKTPSGPEQRQQLLDNEQRAARPGARNFKDDALEKTVSIEPDGTGPSSTGSLDAETDQQAGSGSPGGAAPPRPTRPARSRRRRAGRR